MQTTILIPTDFTIESLSLLKLAMHEQSEGELRIVFVHGIRLTDSITELLFFSPHKQLAQLENEAFREACSVIQNKFITRIASIQTELFTGKTNAAFRQFLETRKIDMVIVPTRKLLKRTSKTSIDLIPFIEKSTVPKIHVAWEAKPISPEKDKLAELFAL